MTPAAISKRVVTDRLGMVQELLRDIAELPLGDRDAFFGDRRNPWAAESSLGPSMGLALWASLRYV